MNTHRSRLRPLFIPQRKYAELNSSPSITGGSLSPDLQPNTPPSFPNQNDLQSPVQKIGNYLLYEQVDTNGSIKIHKALNCDTQEDCICKVLPIKQYRETLAAYWRVDSHSHISQIEEIILGETQAYAFFSCNYGDLHSYVRNKRKLREAEAIRLFKQIMLAVDHCHENGIVLRDLKLRKFVFKNPEKTQLKLEGLEDARVLDCESDDKLVEKHGCPAYVSPEILHTKHFYSGKAADIWSLGVMLYTLLVGRYPFHDTEPSVLFSKISRGQFSIPDTVSSRAKCLIKSLLRKAPEERLTPSEILQHPWFFIGPKVYHSSKSENKNKDQLVPEISLALEENDSLFF